MFLLVDRRSWIAVRVVQTQLGVGHLIQDRRLGRLASRDYQQQRLHDHGIDRKHADEPSPERARR